MNRNRSWTSLVMAFTFACVLIAGTSGVSAGVPRLNDPSWTKHMGTTPTATQKPRPQKKWGKHHSGLRREPNKKQLANLQKASQRKSFHGFCEWFYRWIAQFT